MNMTVLPDKAPSLTTEQIIMMLQHGIITIEEARYMLGLFPTKNPSFEQVKAYRDKIMGQAAVELREVTNELGATGFI